MIKLIYLLRHCSTKWIEEDRLQGRNDIPLSNKGIYEAEQLGCKLKDVPFEKIYTSDLLRAYQTASIISKYHNCQLVKEQDLREISLGVLEGLTREECKVLYPDLWNNWQLMPDRVTFPEGDNVEDFIKVSWNTFDRISRRSEKIILIVSHGVFIRSIVANILLPENIRTMNRTVKVRSGEFVRIKANRNSYTIIKSD